MKKNEKETKSNFTTLMNSLNPKEISKFGKYLRAFYPARQITKTIYPTYESYFKSKKQILEVEVAFRKIYKEVPTTKSLNRFNTELSDLYKELKNFLIQEKITKNDFEREYLWLEILKERQLDKLKKAQFKNLLRTENGSQNGGVWQSLRLFQLHDFAIKDADFLKMYRETESSIRVLEYLERFRLDINLKYASELKNREKVLCIKSADFYFKHFLTFYDEHTEIVGTNTKLYFKLYHFLLDEKLGDFKAVKSFLMKNEALLHPEDQRTTTMYLLNYIAIQIKAGKSNFNTHAFDIYKVALKKGFLMNNGILPLWQFQNIINIACFLKEYKWANNFIEMYHPFLEGTIRTQFLNIAYAMVLFSGEKFAEVVKLLKDIKLKDDMLQMLARLYLLASYYELNLDTNLSGKCDSFIRFIRRSKELKGDNQLAAINFGQKLKKLAIKNISKVALKKEVQETKNLYFRAWLSEKIKTYQPII